MNMREITKSLYFAPYEKEISPVNAIDKRSYQLIATKDSRVWKSSG